jgi:hypothetical protein
MGDNPRQFPSVFKNVRCALLRRFPYSLFFVIEDDALVVIACFSCTSRSVALAKEELSRFLGDGVLSVSAE